MSQFESIKKRIIDVACSNSPSWVCFDYKDDFPEYDDSFVFDCVSALRSMSIKNIEIRNNADSVFMVRCL
ncbi:TPA: hypothetical protein OUF45_005592 [Klebsiella variicola]|nr:MULTISPECIES: hypothetical protein [Klebsiella]HCU0663741.1 hypothetical protein [Klebsiella variicola]EKZ6092426.1 hypothetical protein [Klebsiella pneumoniae]MCM5720446.1 hypothetical protein [Klebsiella pneumoniae]MDD7847196.1 hypothetical protein [Klebsiella quasipneumoniae]MDD7863619.1 hypothetical protein [Klebsiella quasipneumoniae]